MGSLSISRKCFQAVAAMVATAFLCLLFLTGCSSSLDNGGSDFFEDELSFASAKNESANLVMLEEKTKEFESDIDFDSATIDDRARTKDAYYSFSNPIGVNESGPIGRTIIGELVGLYEHGRIAEIMLIEPEPGDPWRRYINDIIYVEVPSAYCNLTEENIGVQIQVQFHMGNCTQITPIKPSSFIFMEQ